MSNPPCLDAEALINLDWNPDLPFMVRMHAVQGERDLLCTQILRFLPRRRLVILAELAGEQVVAKIFLGRHQLRDANREKAGIRALLKAGLNTPAFLDEGEVDGGAKILVFKYLTKAISLDLWWAYAQDMNERCRILQHSLECIARMHEAGIRQDDIHPGNFLCKGDQIFIIDGAAVVDASSRGKMIEKDSIDNLAAFLAEFAPKYDLAAQEVFPSYEMTRAWRPSISRLEVLLSTTNIRRQQRKRKVLAKILRDCSQFCCRSRFNLFLVCDRNSRSENFDKMLSNPDALMASGRSLKMGNTATVSEVEVDGRLLVIKRYNIKSFLHGLRKAWFKSRARRSWRNAHLMGFYEIPGARPIALLERRWGPLCLTSYYISESVSGMDAREYFSHHSYSLDDIRQMIEIVIELQLCKLRHGDLKNTNFLMASQGPVLIDLDSMQEYSSARHFKKAAEKDLERFMLNWRDQPALHESFTRVLAESQNSQTCLLNQLE